MASWSNALANISWEGKVVSDPAHEIIDVETGALERARQLLELLDTRVKIATQTATNTLRQNADKNDSVFNARISALADNLDQFQSLIQSCVNQNRSALEERKRLIEQYNFSCTNK